MSHFTTLVIVHGSETDPQAVAEQMLAPFDENMEVEPYKDYETGTPDDFWWSNLGREAGVLPESGATWQQVRDAYRSHYGEESEDYQIDEQGMYSMSTYNPKSKWDWYSLGGRWTGFFRVKTGAFAVTGCPGLMTGPAPAGTADMVRKYDIDFDGMRLDALGEAGDRIGAFKAVVAEVGAEPETYRSWAEVRESGLSIGEARAVYASQPIVAAWRAVSPWNEVDELFFTHEDWEKRYMNHRVAQATATFAVLDSEGWRERGSMGWFGVVSDEKDGLSWASQVNRMIDNLDDDTWLLVYDLHI